MTGWSGFFWRKSFWKWDSKILGFLWLWSASLRWHILLWLTGSHRGLRQGDPLSPYLFLFCVEGLDAILRRAANNGDINGFSLCRRGPKITHLFFADDCLLFCRATLAECEKIKNILNTHEATSDQMVNKDKTTLFFSRNTNDATQ